MANDVKWIKFIVGTFDGQSFKRIKRTEIGGISYRDKLTAVWVELLDLTAKCNNNGFLVDGNEFPYTNISEIAIMIDRETSELELCMQFYIKEKMIEIIDNIYCLSNWDKFQNNNGLKSIQEYNKIKKQESRERKKKNVMSLTVIDMSKNVNDSSSISISNSLSISNNNIDAYFSTLWGIYPKKESKQQAITTFEHKLRGLTENDAKDKANSIHRVLKPCIIKWQEEDTEYKYIPMFSSWLNSNIEDSKNYRGNKKSAK